MDQEAALDLLNEAKSELGVIYEALSAALSTADERALNEINNSLWDFKNKWRREVAIDQGLTAGIALSKALAALDQGARVNTRPSVKWCSAMYEANYELSQGMAELKRFVVRSAVNEDC